MTPQLAELWAHAKKAGVANGYESEARCLRDHHSFFNLPAGENVIGNRSLSNPTFGLCKKIKTREQKLADTKLNLKAVIVLETTFEKMFNINRCQAEFQGGNIVSIDDGGGLRKVFFES